MLKIFTFKHVLLLIVGRSLLFILFINFACAREENSLSRESNFDFVRETDGKLRGWMRADQFNAVSLLSRMDAIIFIRDSYPVERSPGKDDPAYLQGFSIRKFIRNFERNKTLTERGKPQPERDEILQ